VSTRAVYPGSFDPLTNGHLDLIERSLRIFDELVVAVVTNPAKTGLFADAERVEMIREATEGFRAIEVVIFDGLLVDLVPAQGDQDAKRDGHQPCSRPVRRRQTTQDPNPIITNAIATSMPPLTGPSGCRIRK